MEIGKSLLVEHSQELLGAWSSTPTHPALSSKCNALLPRNCSNAAKCPSPPSSIGILCVIVLYTIIITDCNDM